MSKKRNRDGYKRKVDNKMRDYGDIDDKKKTIRVNFSKKKNKKRGDKLDTVLHEENHRKHKKMSEKSVQKLTKKQMKSMPAKQKKKLYSRYKR